MWYSALKAGMVDASGGLAGAVGNACTEWGGWLSAPAPDRTVLFRWSAGWCLPVGGGVTEA
jgi:hypothetical protein